MVAVTTSTARAAGAAAAVGFVLVAAFQVALALGAPWGKAAWGGANDRLPGRLRLASGFAAALWLLAALVVLRGAGYAWSPVPSGARGWGVWFLVTVLALGTLMNLASRSRLERLIQTPIAAILAILCLIVALS